MGSTVSVMMVIILAFSFMLGPDGNAYVTGYEGVETEIVVPATLNGYSVAGIMQDVFYDCDSLLSVQLPEGLQAIGDDAFSECDSLLTVNLPESLRLIKEDAFYACPNLTLTVVEGSYAHTYAQENAIPYRFAGD